MHVPVTGAENRGQETHRALSPLRAPSGTRPPLPPLQGSLQLLGADRSEGTFPCARGALEKGGLPRNGSRVLSPSGLKVAAVYQVVWKQFTISAARAGAAVFTVPTRRLSVYLFSVSFQGSSETAGLSGRHFPAGRRPPERWEDTRSPASDLTHRLPSPLVPGPRAVVPSGLSPGLPPPVAGPGVLPGSLPRC